MIGLRPFRLLFVAGILSAAGSSASVATACPFCSAPSQTLAEQVAQSDGVCLVQWVDGRAAKEQDPGSSSYEVLQVVKSPPDTLRKGQRIDVARFRAGKKGDLFLLMGTRAGKGNAVEWGSPTEITEPAFQYVAQAPTPEVPAKKRLGYFAKFLEFPDQLVSNDAYAEFANAPYKDIASVALALPRARIRKWIDSADTLQTRLGLYGLMLGLCGDGEDARTLATKIAPNSEDFRIGIDGLIFGYLLLTGPQGLDKIDDWKFKKQPGGKKIAFSETYAAMMALRNMRQYGGGRISDDRLMQSMRILLDQPELADLVIADLARWNDWSVQDRLMAIYGKGDYNIPSIKRAIIRYMLASAEAKPSLLPEASAPLRTASGDGQGHAGGHSLKSVELNYGERGKKYIEELRKRDPRTVKEAERFFFAK